MLNLNDTLRALRWELDRINRAIATLESIPENPTPKPRRGRKSMGQEERTEVSRRMKSYWAKESMNRSRSPDISNPQ